MSYTHISPLFKNAWNTKAMLRQDAIASEQLIYKAGTIYSIYRLLMAVFLILNNRVANEILKYFEKNSYNLLSSDIEHIILGLYLLMSFVLALMLIFYKNKIRKQLFIGLLFDIVGLSLLMYSGVAKDLQIVLLFMVITAAGFMLLELRQGITITLMAILSLIFQQLFFIFSDTEGFLNITDTLLLSMSLLAVGLLSWSISSRVVSAEMTAHQNAQEIGRLNAINETVISKMVNGVIVIEQTGRMVIINETARKLLRLKIKKITTNEDRLDYMFHMEHQIGEHYPKLYDWYRYDAHTPYFWLDLPQEQDYPANRVRIGQKNLPEYGKLLILEDLSREESHAQQLKLASLGQLSASIAHEIRNPLGAISTASQMLMEDVSQDDPDFELYTMIYNQTKRVNQIIEDVMRLSRQEPPQQERLALKAWLSTFLRQYYKGKSIGVKFVKNDEVLFDPNHLEQILINLLNNALRHTVVIPNQPSVIVYVHGDSVNLFLDIIDHGAGVAKEDEDNLFNPFFTRSKGEGGTGLGLYLSKAFSEANHAKLIYLRQKKTCFRLIIPIVSNFLD